MSLYDVLESVSVGAEKYKSENEQRREKKSGAAEFQLRDSSHFTKCQIQAEAALSVFRSRCRAGFLQSRRSCSVLMLSCSVV